VPVPMPEEKKQGEQKYEGEDADLEKYSKISRCIKQIREKTEKLAKRSAKFDGKTDRAGRDKVANAVTEYMKEVQGLIMEAKSAFEYCKAKNEQLQKDPEMKDSVKLQVRENLYATRARQFQQAVAEYNAKKEQHQKRVYEWTLRQADMSGSTNLNEEEKEMLAEAVAAGEYEEVVQQAVSQSLRAALQNLHERSAAIKKLTQETKVILNMFQDLQLLINIQGETIDSIETRVANAKQYVHKGQKKLEEGARYQDKARRCKCILLIILLGVLVAILVPVLALKAA